MNSSTEISPYQLILNELHKLSSMQSELFADLATTWCAPAPSATVSPMPAPSIAADNWGGLFGGGNHSDELLREAPIFSDNWGGLFDGYVDPVEKQYEAPTVADNWGGLFKQPAHDPEERDLYSIDVLGTACAVPVALPNIALQELPLSPVEDATPACGVPASESPAPAPSAATSLTEHAREFIIALDDADEEFESAKDGDSDRLCNRPVRDIALLHDDSLVAALGGTAMDAAAGPEASQHSWLTVDPVDAGVVPSRCSTLGRGSVQCGVAYVTTTPAPLRPRRRLRRAAPRPPWLHRPRHAPPSPLWLRRPRRTPPRRHGRRSGRPPWRFRIRSPRVRGLWRASPRHHGRRPWRAPPRPPWLLQEPPLPSGSRIRARHRAAAPTCLPPLDAATASSLVLAAAWSTSGAHSVQAARVFDEMSSSHSSTTVPEFTLQFVSLLHVLKSTRDVSSLGTDHDAQFRKEEYMQLWKPSWYVSIQQLRGVLAAIVNTWKCLMRPRRLVFPVPLGISWLDTEVMNASVLSKLKIVIHGKCSDKGVCSSHYVIRRALHEFSTGWNFCLIILPSAWCKFEVLVSDHPFSSISRYVFDRGRYRKLIFSVMAMVWRSLYASRIHAVIFTIRFSSNQFDVHFSHMNLMVYITLNLLSCFSIIMIIEMQSVSNMVLTLYIFRHHTVLHELQPFSHGAVPADHLISVPEILIWAWKRRISIFLAPVDLFRLVPWDPGGSKLLLSVSKACCELILEHVQRKCGGDYHCFLLGGGQLQNISENPECPVLVGVLVRLEIKHPGVHLYSIHLSFLCCNASVLTLGLGTSESQDQNRFFHVDELWGSSNEIYYDFSVLMALFLQRHYGLHCPTWIQSTIFTLLHFCLETDVLWVWPLPWPPDHLFWFKYAIIHLGYLGVLWSDFGIQLQAPLFIYCFQMHLSCTIPPEELRLKASDAELEPAPWPLVTIVVMCSVRYYSGRFWQLPWHIPVQQGISRLRTTGFGISWQYRASMSVIPSLLVGLLQSFSDQIALHSGLCSGLNLLDTNLSLHWDPGGAKLLHQLGGKPQLKKGGISVYTLGLLTVTAHMELVTHMVADTNLKPDILVVPPQISFGCTQNADCSLDWSFILGANTSGTYTSGAALLLVRDDGFSSVLMVTSSELLGALLVGQSESLIFCWELMREYTADGLSSTSFEPKFLQFTWDPGGSILLRLGGKPKLKKGGMLGTSCGWAFTWAMGQAPCPVTSRWKTTNAKGHRRTKEESINQSNITEPTGC